MIRSVGQIISSELAKEKGFEGVLISQIVLEATRRVLGENLSLQLKLLGFKNGMVIIGAPNSVFVQELSFFEDEIKNRVNGLIGENILKKVKFVELWKRKRR